MDGTLLTTVQPEKPMRMDEIHLQGLIFPYKKMDVTLLTTVHNNFDEPITFVLGLFCYENFSSL